MNLRVSLEDMETALADLRAKTDMESYQQMNQLYQAKQEIEKLSEENAEMRQKIKKFEAMLVDSTTTNRELRSQLFDREDKNRQLLVDNSALQQKQYHYLIRSTTRVRLSSKSKTLQS